MKMETNHIIEELRARAALGWTPEQKAWLEQQANDARVVHCVRMRDAFTPEQMAFIRECYRTQQKACYRNAAELIRLIAPPGGNWLMFPEPVRYVEGYTCPCGILIEHAFIKIGDKYIDPTFERALHRDVRKEMYASCIELEPLTMAKYQLETGFYGGLYVYDYMCKNQPEFAAQIRARNPHNRR